MLGLDASRMLPGGAAIADLLGTARTCPRPVPARASTPRGPTRAVGPGNDAARAAAAVASG